jgi:hypothetical protein
MRTLVDEKTGLSKQDQWLQAFQQNEKSKAKAISDMQTLALFGVRHPHTNKITNKGITPQINCVDRTYEMPADLYLETIGADANVIYDPLDYSRILIETSKHRFIAHTYEKLPSAIADYKPGDRSRLHARIEEKKNHVQQIQARKDQRQDILQRNRLNAESLLQAGVMPKELMHGAAQLYHETKNTKGIQYDALDQM